MKMTSGIAVCVDGDNISPTRATAIRKLANKHGRADTLRVYGNVPKTPGWAETAGYRLIHSGSGSNATDILMTVDAMELVLRESYKTILIASSDHDFTHLALRLRELGVTVIGIGEAKAKNAFRQACTVFEELSDDSANGARGPSDLDWKIRGIIAVNSKKGLGMRIADLAPIMHTKHGTKISQLPERNWRTYLNARATLFELDPKGPDAKVRFRPDGFVS